MNTPPFQPKLASGLPLGESISEHGKLILYAIPMTHLQYSSVVFDDVDEYRQWADEVGWELESTQLSRGPNQITFDHIALPEISVAHHRAKQAMYDVFTIPSRHVVFVICRAKLPAVWCGRDLPASLLAIHRPGRTYCARLPAGWDTYEFTVSEDLIERTELFPPDFLEKTTRLEQAFLPLVEPQTGLFLKRIDSYFQVDRTANGVLEGAASPTELYDFILYGLQQLIDTGLHAGPSRLLKHTRRPDLVEQARDDVAKACGGNKAAGTRVRKMMQDVRNAAQDVRKRVLELRSEAPQ